jgi:hypothetical protein
VVVGVAEVGVAEGAEEEEAGVVAIETEETMMIIMMATISVTKRGRRETILGIGMNLATGMAERSGAGTEIVVIVMTKDGREGEEGAGEEEEEEGGDLAAIVTMTEEMREGVGGDVTIGAREMKELERDKRDVVKAETEMTGTERERIMIIKYSHKKSSTSVFGVY